MVESEDKMSRPFNEDRQMAIKLGFKTYDGAVHTCGYRERYVKGGGCVHCGRRLATEQREALKFVRANPTGFTPQYEPDEQLVNHVPESPEEVVDSPEPSPYEQALDDLM